MRGMVSVNLVRRKFSLYFVGINVPMFSSTDCMLAGDEEEEDAVPPPVWFGGDD